MTLEQILKVVCDVYGVDPLELSGRSRIGRIAHARAAYCYFSRRYTQASWATISRFINRDHSTAMMAAARFFDVADKRCEIEKAGRVDESLKGLHSAPVSRHYNPWRWVGQNLPPLAVSA